MPLPKPVRAPVPSPPGRDHRFPVRLLFGLWVVAAIVLAAPAERAAAQTGSATPVNVPDANLRIALENALGKTRGETITRAEMATLTGTLDLSIPYWSGTPPANAIGNLTGLEYLTGVEKLWLDFHRITDLRPLAGLTQLTDLRLRSNRITDLSPLTGLTRLTILYLGSSGGITDLSPLAGLTRMQKFQLNNAQVSDLSPLRDMTALTLLELTGNRIKDLSPLAGLTQLTSLTLPENLIRDLSPLRNMTALEHLLLSDNRVTDLSPLSGMTALRQLEFNRNEGVSNLSALQGLTSLVQLRMDGTGVEDLSPLVANTGLGSGDHIYMRNVPNLNAAAVDDPGPPFVPGHISTLRGRGATVHTSSPPRLDRTVRGVNVTPGVEELAVSWTAVTSTTSFNPQGYRVYWWSGGERRTSGTGNRRTSGAGHHDVAGQSTASYTIPNLNPGTEYKVAVRPMTPAGDLSATAFGTPEAASPSESPPASPPETPANWVGGVTVTPGVESLVVSWNPVAGANGYNVQWRSDGQEYDPEARQARTNDAGTTSHTIPNLTPGVEYTVRVIATKAIAPDSTSDEAFGTPKAPSAPDRVGGVTVTPDVESLVVSWDSVDDADGYKVQWKSGEQDYDPEARQARTGDAATTGHTIPNLIPGVKYTVRVVATKADGTDGEPSDEADGTPKAPAPGQVGGVTVTPDVESLVVSWDSVDDADGYKVQWKSGEQDYDPEARQARIGDAATTGHTIPNLTPGTGYKVRVIATKANASDGEPSDEANGTPKAPAPGQVGGVTVTPGVESLVVSWNPVADADGYKVQWRSDEQDYDPEARQARIGDAATTGHTIPNLTPGTGYTVRVIAVMADGTDGEPSAETDGTPMAPAPSQVGGVTVTPGVESLVVSWNPVADADGYKIQWKSGEQDYDPEARQARIGDAAATGHTIPNLTPGTGYAVRVIATKVNAVSDGEPSAEADGTPMAPAPARVEGVTVTPGVESLVVSWNPVADADGYKIQWKSGEQDYDPEARQARIGDAAATGHTIPNLTPGTGYAVRVIATKVNAVSDGEPSAEADGTPMAPAPARVEGVTVTPGVESLVVSWNPVADADGYKIQWKSGEQDYDPEARQARIGDAAATGHTIPNLTPGIGYAVRVIATRANARDGDASEEVTGVPGRRVDVSVADAAAVEGAAVAFPVSLSEPSVAVVTLTWITEAGGTAQAGADYRAVANGSLTLLPGDTAGTLRVRTLDDGQVEPAETFRVRLTEATNAAMDPKAASATGTITDNDTEAVRGRALGLVLAGMGRMIAADAVDMVGERFIRPPTAARMALGGLAINPVGVLDGGQAPALASGLWSWAQGRDFRRPSATELLSRSSFELPLSRRAAAGAADGTGWRLWGRGTAGRFAGTPQTGFRMDGKVSGGYVGFDWRADRDAVLGMAVARTKGDADYEAEAVTSGTVDLEMTSVLPYAHWSPRPDLGMWGLLGVGGGEVELEDEAGRVETDVRMLTAAFGLRQELAAWRGIDMAVKADTFLTELRTEAARGLPRTSGDAKRLRLRLEGRKEWEISPVSRMTPSLDIGGRWDDGDAESGLGVEVGGGLAYMHTGLGLEVDARGRILLAHGKSAFDERGGSLTVKFEPGRAGRGPRLAVRPGWGAQGSRITQMWDGAEALRPSSGPSADGTSGWSPDRVDLDAGYGLAYRGTGLLTPYAGLSMAGSQSRAWKAGIRLEMGDRLDLNVEGRRGRGNDIMFHARVRW